MLHPFAFCFLYYSSIDDDELSLYQNLTALQFDIKSASPEEINFL
jgi:hypothetical protein